MPKIIWDGDAKPEFLPKVLDEIAQLESNGLARAGDLIFHHIWLKDDPYDDGIILSGKDGDDAYYAEFVPAYVPAF